MSKLPLAVLVTLAAGCAAKKSTIPTALSNLEGAVEDIFDPVLAGDLATARTTADTVPELWSSYRPRAQRDGVPASAVAAIDQAVAQLPGALAGSPVLIDACRAVNAISAPMAAVFAVYHPDVPAPVLDLDYLGREVLLDARAHDYEKARAHVDQIEAVWHDLRATVVASGGTAEASDFDAMVLGARTATTAMSSPDLEAAARSELEVVDAIETVFSTADKGD